MAEGARRHRAAMSPSASPASPGPAGGSPEKPVGTVHVAVAGPGEGSGRASRGAISGQPRAHPHVRRADGARNAAPAPPGGVAAASAARGVPGLSPRWIGLVAGSYLLGSLSFSLAVVWLLQRADVRKLGSSNAGATNVLRAAGRWPALLVLLLDITKGIVPVRVARGAPSEIVAAAAFAVVVGHVFPVFFGFRGGRGVATGFGRWWRCCRWRPAAAVAIFALTVVTTRYVSLGSILSAAALPVLAVLFAPPRLGARGAEAPWCSPALWRPGRLPPRGEPGPPPRRHRTPSGRRRG